MIQVLMVFISWLRRERDTAAKADVFSTFAEWDSDADHHAYRDL
ncbi:hypothetical protein ABIB57_004553 [Devosia sp. UYZn731]